MDDSSQNGIIIKSAGVSKKVFVKYTILLLSVWTLLMLISIANDIYQIKNTSKELAIKEARTHFNRDQAFRYWGALHGGVYVEIDETTPPNIYLSHVKERDIETASGKKLTLMNPAYMVRQMSSFFSEQYGVVGHITSLKPLRPENAPDEWESMALQSFEEGKKEVSEFVDINGAPYLRLMQPMVAKKPCLKCHGHQGYKEGDIRGGVSVSVPISSYLEMESRSIKSHMFWSGLIWFFGLLGITFGAKRIKHTEDRLIRDNALREALDEADFNIRVNEALLLGARAILSKPEFAEVARMIFDSCKELIGATAGYVALMNEAGDNNDVLFLDAGGLPCYVDPNLPMPIRGLRGDVYTTGRVEYDNDFMKSEWMEFMPKGHVTLNNVMFSPLNIEGKTVGLMGLANKECDFTDDDARIAGAFGELAAIAFSNSRSKEMLIRSEEQFRSVVQTANDAIISADRDGNIISWNSGAENIFGHTSEEAIGKSLLIVVPERLRDAHQNGFNRVIETGKSYIIGKTVELTGIRKDGSEVPVELSLAKLELKENIILNAIIRDISDRKKVEGELKKHRDHLEELVKERTGELTDTNRLLREEVTVRERAEKELRARQLALQFIADFNEMITYLETDLMVHKAMKFISETLGYNLLSLALCEPQNERFERISLVFTDILALGEGKNYVEYKDTVLSEVIKEKRPRYYSDLASEDFKYPIEKHLINEGLKSAFLIPLIYENKCLGTLNVGSKEINGISRDDRNLFNLIVPRFALALQNSNLYNKLQTNEAALSESQRISQLGSWEWDIPSNELKWSDETYRILHHDPQTFEPKYDDFIKMLHPDDSEKVFKNIEATLEGEEEYKIDHRVVTSNGEIKYVISQGVVQRDEKGEPIRMVGTMIDITARKKAEDAIRNIAAGITGATTEEIFDSIVLNLARTLYADFVVIDILVNEKSKARTLSSCVDGKITDNFEYELAGTPCGKVAEDKKMFIVSNDLLEHFPQDEFMVENNIMSYAGAPLFDSKGDIIGLLTLLSRKPFEDLRILENILQIFAVRAATEIERMKSEEELATANEELSSTNEELEAVNEELVAFNEELGALNKEQEVMNLELVQSKKDLTSEKNKVDAILASVGDVMSIQDRDYNILYVNDASKEVFGEDIIGKKCYTVYDRKDDICDDCPVKKAYESGELVRVVKELTSKDNKKRYYDITATPVRDEKGEIIAAIELAKDVTEQINYEREQGKLIEELEHVNKELDDFAHTVSHDLKAPLRGIMSLVNWISADYKDKFDDEGRENLKLLLMRSKRMHNLIDGILKYSRAGHVEEDKRIDINLRDLIHLVVKMVSPPENISIKVVGEIPTIQFSVVLLEQVFLNLLSNAIKFSDKPKGEIEISCVDEDDHYTISVSDNGPGIEKKHFNNIFKLFRTVITREDPESSGVGLAVVKKIIEAYDGKVWVESKVGEGATFIFTISKQSPDK